MFSVVSALIALVRSGGMGGSEGEQKGAFRSAVSDARSGGRAGV